MSLQRDLSSRPHLPPYHANSALQLVVANGVTFIMFHFVRVIMLTFHVSQEEVFNMMFPNFGLASLEIFQQKWWTILTYGWIHHGFFDWFTNMIWLYLFGSVLQNLTSYKQNIPLFVMGLLAGGLFYISGFFLAPEWYKSTGFFMGAQSGVLAIGLAAFAFAPAYKIRISANFSIPLYLALGVYILLNLVVFIPEQWNILLLCLGGAITGLVYAKFLRLGFHPGEWFYTLGNKVQQFTNPDEEALHLKKTKKRMDILRKMYEPRVGISQKQIDEILDKIHAKGYDALSQEEKDILIRAGSQDSK
jgi:membrane associated rhomboid family serine protease